MIEPCGHRVLVKPDPPEQVTAGGIVIPDTTQQKEKAATTIGTVVLVGRNAFKGWDDGHAWAEVGDRVLYAKYGGKVVKDQQTNEEFVVLNDEDIIARIKKETA